MTDRSSDLAWGFKIKVPGFSLFSLYAHIVFLKSLRKRVLTMLPMLALNSWAGTILLPLQWLQLQDAPLYLAQFCCSSLLPRHLDSAQALHHLHHVICVLCDQDLVRWFTQVQSVVWMELTVGTSLISRWAPQTASPVLLDNWQLRGPTEHCSIFNSRYFIRVYGWS